MFEKRYRERLLQRGETGLLRTPPSIAGREGKYILIGSQRILNFSSNDYLGLGVSKEIRLKAAYNFRKYGTSSSSSRLVSGNYELISRAEEQYARYFGYDTALFFPSGYQANTGILSALFEKGDTLVFDKHIHASSVKGMALSGATLQGYNHNSMPHLRRRLEGNIKRENPPNPPLTKGGFLNKQVAVLTESLFSMDGDFLDIEWFGKIKEEHGFFSIVDEAHAFGAVGEGGRGLARSVADVAVGTFGKALGLFGAFVLMPQTVREFLFNFSSPLIYSTTLPEAHAATAINILEIIASGSEIRKWLSNISLIMKNCLLAEGFEVRGDAHIIAVGIGGESTAMNISEGLLARNIFALPVRYPTVPRGKAILRIGMTSLHTEEDVKIFINALKDIKQKQGLRNA
jgi:8-amino-7-oxononanoate synthase